MATALVTPEELSSWLQEDLDTATATLLISQATAIVQEATGQTLVQVLGDTVVLDGQPEPYLALPQRPVTAVSSVTMQDANLAPITLDPSQYTLRGNRIWRAWGWQFAAVFLPPVKMLGYQYLEWPPPSQVTVVCDHGWAPGAPQLEPARSAVFALCAQAYVNPGGSRSVAVDDYTETYSDQFAGMQMPESTKALLRRRYGHSVGSVVPR